MKNKKLYIAGLLVAGLISVPLLSSTAFSKATKVSTKEVQQESQNKSSKEEEKNYDKWNLTCGQPNKEGKKQCRVSQRISEGKNDLLAISFVAGIDKDKKPLTVMRIFTPLGVNLLAKLSFAIDDDKKPMGMPFKSCGAQGCAVVVGLKDDFIDKLKKASTLHIAYQGSNNAKPVKIDVAMKGFPKAHDALLKTVTQ